MTEAWKEFPQQRKERENLFAKSDNNIASNITQHTMAGCQGTAQVV